MTMHTDISKTTRNIIGRYENHRPVTATIKAIVIEVLPPQHVSEWLIETPFS
jgi:hypothetical protein